MTDWRTLIAQWKLRYCAQTLQPLTLALVESASREIGPFTGDLVEFYLSTNGISKESFAIFPLADDKDPKRTWNSIQHANRPDQPDFLVGYGDVRDRFLTIGQVAYQRAALVERATGAFWLEDADDLVHTTHSLASFIEACLKDVSDGG